MANIVGIDLGTTMSAISVLNTIGKPEIIPNRDGERITPSVIFFENNSKILIGQEAKNIAGTDPHLVAKEFKREMHNDAYRFNVHGKDYSASELSSFILKKLTQDASKQIGPITDVVISVPAYFKESERNATIQAGKLAGLNEINIINEPTAAALYYATIADIKGRGLVYDLGGGTFDVTVSDTHGKTIDIVASSGDHHLGGVDFDQAMLELMEEKYKAVKGGELYSDEASRHEFLLDAEKLKKSLSARSSVKEKLVGDNGKAIIEFTQQEFEAKISTYISKTELLVEQVLDESDSEPEDIDYILLVGGSTRIPAIKKSIKKMMGKEPIVAVNVDEAVSLGAALKAGMVMVQNNPQNVSAAITDEMSTISVTDVANHSYGTISLSYDEVLQKEVLKNSILIKKNTPLPCSETQTFYTISDNQQALEIEITQGEDTDPDFVNIIHKEDMELPANRPASQPIEITYSYDENQMMKCTFKDINAGSIKEIDVQLSIKESTKNALDAFLVE